MDNETVLHASRKKGTFVTDKLIIRGGKKLAGTLQVDGAKNSAVALIPAAILAESEVVLEGLPDISDVHTLYNIFRRAWRHGSL